MLALATRTLVTLAGFGQSLKAKQMALDQLYRVALAYSCLQQEQGVKSFFLDFKSTVGQRFMWSTKRVF